MRSPSPYSRETVTACMVRQPTSMGTSIYRRTLHNFMTILSRRTFMHRPLWTTVTEAILMLQPRIPITTPLRRTAMRGI